MATRTSARKKTAGGARKSEARRRRKVARKSAASTRAPRRAASRAAEIDVVFKGLMAIEPPISRNPNDLDSTFRAKLDAALADLAAQDSPFKFVEGFRTVERQQVALRVWPAERCSVRSRRKHRDFQRRRAELVESPGQRHRRLWQGSRLLPAEA